MRNTSNNVREPSTASNACEKHFNHKQKTHAASLACMAFKNPSKPSRKSSSWAFKTSRETPPSPSFETLVNLQKNGSYYSKSSSMETHKLCCSLETTSSHPALQNGSNGSILQPRYALARRPSSFLSKPAKSWPSCCKTNPQFPSCNFVFACLSQTGVKLAFLSNFPSYFACMHVLSVKQSLYWCLLERGALLSLQLGRPR